MIREGIQKAVGGENLTREEAYGVMQTIMAGEATPAQIACYITALRMKGETVEEITGSAQAMREKVVPITTTRTPLVDTCGTGGDAQHTFNISTTAAFVVAGAGAAVAKHGNRSVSSKCGSADVLEHLGVDLQRSAEDVSRCLEEIGIGFLFAPLLHPAMKHAIGPRREIGIRTVFNILGPLTNPAGAPHQVLGVYHPDLTETLAQVLVNLGSHHVFVAHGLDGLDEISTVGETRLSEGCEGQVRTYTLTPEDLGLPRASLDDLRGGDAATNADLLVRVLEGEAGPRRDVVVANAAAGIVAAGLAEDLCAGVALAQESLASGAARERLAALQAWG
jgi:anthranilate phosphoribosyltransferase